jgi:cytidylate kinase
MIVAIFGSTCTGKTSVARLVSTAFGTPFRSCGDVVSDRARSAGVAIDSLSISEHIIVDNETREMCAERDFLIVEGRYLDQVLTTVSRDLFLVELTAVCAEREVRWGCRSGTAPNREAILTSDRQDCEFRVLAYSGLVGLKADLTIDNSSMTIQECADSILARVR